MSARFHLFVSDSVCTLDTRQSLQGRRVQRAWVFHASFISLGPHAFKIKASYFSSSLLKGFTPPSLQIPDREMFNHPETCENTLGNHTLMHTLVDSQPCNISWHGLYLNTCLVVAIKVRMDLLLPVFGNYYHGNEELVCQGPLYTAGQEGGTNCSPWESQTHCDVGHVRAFSHINCLLVHQKPCYPTLCVTKLRFPNSEIIPKAETCNHVKYQLARSANKISLWWESKTNKQAKLKQAVLEPQHSAQTERLCQEVECQRKKLIKS